MAHLVKTKISIISCSVVVSVFFRALQMNFYNTPTLKRWDEKKPLNWEDFKGIPFPFGPFDAAVNSRVYVEFDSASMKYTAYAAQNDVHSWTRYKTDDNLLKHEQYHFNVTEIFARKLNKYLSENNLTPEGVEEKLTEINQELSVFQDQYDAETDHNLLQSKQDYWEFKIDSALHEYKTDKGLVTDNISGISAISYKEPQYHSAINKNGLAYRGFGMLGYKMQFMILSFKKTNIAEVDFVEYCKRNYLNDTTILISSQFISEDNLQYYETKLINTAYTYEIWNRFYKHENELFIASVFAPYDSVNREYEQMKKTFFNSISFSDTRDYWIMKANLAEEKLEFNHLESVEKTKDKGDYQKICINENTNNIFYKPPFFDKNGNLFIAFDIIDCPVDSVLNNVVMINREEIFDFKVDSTEQLAVIPDSLLSNSPYLLEFGYVLKKDSLNACFQFYKQMVDKPEHTDPLIR